MQANSKNFSYSRNLFSDILAYIKNNVYLCSEFLGSNVSHNFCFNGACRCETMGIFYCLVVDIDDIIETVVDIKYIVNRLKNFIRVDVIDFCYKVSINFDEKVYNNSIIKGFIYKDEDFYYEVSSVFN